MADYNSMKCNIYPRVSRESFARGQRVCEDEWRVMDEKKNSRNMYNIFDVADAGIRGKVESVYF